MTPFPRVGGGEELLKLTPGHGHGDLHVDRIPLPWPRLRQASLVVCRTQILPRQVPRAQPPTWCSLGVALPGRLAAVSAVELCPGRSGVSAVELCPGRSGVSAVELCPGRSGVSAVELCPGRSGVSAVELCPGEVRRVCRGVVSQEVRRVCRGVVSREVRRVCRGVVSRGGQACLPWSCVPGDQACLPWSCVPGGQACLPWSCVPGRSGRVCRGVVSREVRPCLPWSCVPGGQACLPWSCVPGGQACLPWSCVPGGQACLPWSCVPGRSGVSAVELCPGEVRRVCRGVVSRGGQAGLGPEPGRHAHVSANGLQQTPERPSRKGQEGRLPAIVWTRKSWTGRRGRPPRACLLTAHGKALCCPLPTLPTVGPAPPA
nr:latent-transforming growth factor beta-binding protein 1-like isoform X3 [Oryctolagus cuniculus]